ncbi:MAG: DUF3499 domain-containing protein [Dermatophilaceae bacterium]
MLERRCSRMGCRHGAVATLTYVYSDSTAVVGPLATYAEPHTYDLCTDHAERLTPPRGWDIVRLTRDEESFAATVPGPARIDDDLSAIVDAVREGSFETPHIVQVPAQTPATPTSWETGATRGHLRAVRSVPDPLDG